MTLTKAWLWAGMLSKYGALTRWQAFKLVITWWLFNLSTFSSMMDEVKK